MTSKAPLQNGRQIDLLYRWLREDVSDEIPNLIKRIISKRMWKQHQFERTGKIYQFESFGEFVETEPPGGLGSTLAQINYICRDDKEALDMIDQVVKNPDGRPKTVYIVHSLEKRKTHHNIRPAGNSIQRGLRLLRERAENDNKIAKIRDRVLAGEITVNAGLIEAGLRIPRTSIPIGDVDAAAKTLQRAFSDSQIKQLINKLNSREK